MPFKKAKLPVYKHADLAVNPSLGQPTSIEGLSVGIGHPSPDTDLFKRHFRSDFISILLITKGEVTIGANLEKYCVGENGVFISAAHVVKQLIKTKKDSRFNVISFTADFLGKIGMPKNAPEVLDYISSQFNPHWELDKKDASLLSGLMQALEKRCEEYQTHLFGKELLFHTFNILLFEMSALSKKYSRRSNNRLSLKENLVMNFVTLVQQQFSRVRGVQAYAKQLNVTAKYLTETVKEISGKNAGEIIDDFVVLEAKLMLDNPALSIGEIADTLSFSNQSFFGKYFKRLTGLSPKEYRHTLQ